MANADDDEIRFFVPGKPAPGGSKKSFSHRHSGKIIVMDDAVGNRDWKAKVADFARRAYQGPLLDGPVYAEFHFGMPRPKRHYYTSKKRAGQLRDDAPIWCISKPDRTKVLRSTEDALLNVLLKDDAIIVSGPVTKTYSETPGVEIVLKRIPQG